VAAALVMEALAKHCELNPEDAHTLGILHAIGRVLINRVIEEQGYTIYWDGHQPIEEWERGAVGFDFAQAGAMLLKHWHFPSPSCGVIRWQLNPGRIVKPVSLLGALQFTTRLLALTGLQFENQDWPFPENDSFVRASGLTHEAVSQMILTCQKDLQSIVQTVDLNG
jgi:HD-like signal output (HDOD) protein